MASSTSIGTYGGKPIYSPSQEIENCREAGISPHEFLGKANSFTNPIGPNPGIGYLLMMRKDVVDLLATGSRFDLTIGIDDYLTPGSDTTMETKVTLGNLILIKADSIIPSNPPDSDDQIMLVEVADIRYLLQRVIIDKAYNLKPPVSPLLSPEAISIANDSRIFGSTETDTLEPVADALNDYDRFVLGGMDSDIQAADDARSSAYLLPLLYRNTMKRIEGDSVAFPNNIGFVNWTLQEILEDLWDQIPAGYSVNNPFLSIEAHTKNSFTTTPSTCPDNQIFSGMSVIDAVCRLLLEYGYHLGYDPIAEEFHVVIPGLDQTYDEIEETSQITDAVSSLLQTTKSVYSKDAILPEKVSIKFPRHYIAAGPNYWFDEYYEYEYSFSQFKTDASKTATGITPTADTKEFLFCQNAAIMTTPTQADYDGADTALDDEGDSQFGDLGFYGTSELPDPFNKTELDNIAKAIGFRFYSQRFDAFDSDGTYSSTRQVYSGCLPFLHTGQVHGIAWVDIGDGWKTTLAFDPRYPFITKRHVIPRNRYYYEIVLGYVVDNGVADVMIPNPGGSAETFEEQLVRTATRLKISPWNGLSLGIGSYVTISRAYHKWYAFPLDYV